MHVQAKRTQIEIATQIFGGNQREDLRALVLAFEAQNPDIKLNLKLFRETGYIEQVDLWLKSNQGPDLIYWYGGRRVEHYANRDLVQSIDHIWKKYQLDDQYPTPIQNAVKINGEAYSIPVSFSLVSLYYDTDLLWKLKLEVPETWNELITSCHHLRKQGIDLFSIGSQTGWSLHPWFDYLNLRINGLEIHNELLSGEMSFQDPRIVRVFEHWKELLENKCINVNHASLQVEQAFPRIVQGLSLFTMTTWVPSAISSDHIYRRVDVAEFPIINPTIPKYTVAPVNGFMVPSYVDLSPAMEKVLVFLSSEAYQTKIGSTMRHLPANKYSKTWDIPHMKKMTLLLRNSPGGIQYFDRNMDILFSERSPHIFASFLEHQDIDIVTQQLETLRQRVFDLTP